MKAVTALLLIFFSGQSFAASFDCAKAATPIENAICSDAELSSLDEEMASLFSIARTATDEVELKAGQRKWLTEVRNVCEDTGCLSLEYKSRINNLAAMSHRDPPYPTKQMAETDPIETVSESNASAIAEAQAPVAETQAAVSENQAPVPQLQAPQSSEPPLSNPTPTYNSPTQTSLVPNKPSEPQPSKKYLDNITSFQWKLIGLGLLVNGLLSIYLHKSEKLVIYKDYTDAALTGLAPLLALVTYYTLVFFEVIPDVAKLISLCVLVALLVVVTISTAKNNGLSIFFLMALITKITIVSLYYAIMAALLAASGFGSRQAGESQAAFRARMRRQARASRAAAAATTVGFAALSAWVCKEPEFTPLGDYFKPIQTQP